MNKIHCLVAIVMAFFSEVYANAQQVAPTT